MKSPGGDREAVIFTHHGLQIELSDEWWHEAAMVGFVPSGDAYRASPDPFNREIHTIRIDDVGAVRRSPGVGIFNNCKNTGATGRERVVRILRGFRLDEAIPPVEIVGCALGYPYPCAEGRLAT